MKRNDGPLGKDICRIISTAAILVLVSALLLASASCRKHSVETVTVASQQRSPSTDEKVLITTTQLPPHNSDLEAAGDRIAEARVDLKHKNLAAALRAITLAQERVRKASINEIDVGTDSSLASIIRRLQIVEQEIQRRELRAADSELRRLSQELNR